MLARHVQRTPLEYSVKRTWSGPFLQGTPPIVPRTEQRAHGASPLRRLTRRREPSRRLDPQRNGRFHHRPSRRYVRQRRAGDTHCTVAITAIGRQARGNQVSNLPEFNHQLGQQLYCCASRRSGSTTAGPTENRRVIYRSPPRCLVGRSRATWLEFAREGSSSRASLRSVGQYPPRGDRDRRQPGDRRWIERPLVWA